MPDPTPEIDFGGATPILRVSNLEPGDYTLAVFAWSSANNRWLPARVAPLTVNSK